MKVLANGRLTTSQLNSFKGFLLTNPMDLILIPPLYPKLYVNLHYAIKLKKPIKLLNDHNDAAQYQFNGHHRANNYPLVDYSILVPC